MDQELVGRVYSLARIRAYTLLSNSDGTTNRDRQARADNWQPLVLTVKALRPVTALPRRLHIDFCWASFDEFAPQPASPGLPAARYSVRNVATVWRPAQSFALNVGPMYDTGVWICVWVSTPFSFHSRQNALERHRCGPAPEAR